MIKIGLITGDLKQNKSGIGTYVFQLIEDLKKNTDLTLIKHPFGDDVLGCSSVLSSIPRRSFSHILWSQALSLKKQSLKKLDIIHNPAQYPVSPNIGQNYIVTIHDLIPILYPQYVGSIFSIQAKLYYPYMLKRASKIITVSNHTKDDILKIYKIPDQKIEVVYSGVSNHFNPSSPEEKKRIKQKYNLNHPFILFVGAIEPKKNIELLIKAYYICQKSNPYFDLVIAGKKAWKFETVFKLIQSLNLSKKIHILNFVPYEDLPALYSSAEVFVFPSRYEGFGFPPLEAMKCGTPVITSNVSSLPEIMGKEGLMINPNDYEQLSELILKLLSDPEFHNQYSLYSLDRAKKFSWKKTASKTLEVYNSVIEDGK
nr:glycosyltransferase family 1 protein [uncultured Methanospirillum sp.]